MTAIAQRRPAATVSDMSDTFTAEVQLGSPVHAWLESFHGRRDVVHELDAGWGVADLAAGRPAAGVYPAPRPAIADPVQLKVLQLCQETVDEARLREFAPHGWRALWTRALAPMVDSGFLAVAYGEAGQRRFTAQVPVVDPYLDLVAVELKLRDWRRAIGQAVRYRVFAERSYVALPAYQISASVLSEAERAGVGVCAVEPAPNLESGGRVSEVLPAPFATPLQPGRRRWASECLATALFAPGERRAGAPLRV